MPYPSQKPEPMWPKTDRIGESLAAARVSGLSVASGSNPPAMNRSGGLSRTDWAGRGVGGGPRIGAGRPCSGAAWTATLESRGAGRLLWSRETAALRALGAKGRARRRPSDPLAAQWRAGAAVGVQSPAKDSSSAATSLQWPVKIRVLKPAVFFKLGF